MVVLDYGAAVYVTACFDVLERLAADRYGVPPREPFGAFKNTLNDAAAELARGSSPVGTCADTSDDGEIRSLVVSASVSTKEAAELLEISTAGVTYLVRRGHLEASRFGRAWAISATSVAAYRAARKRKDAA